MKKFLAHFFFLLCFGNGFAQEPYFRHFGVEQGLPSSEVYDVLQDRNGFIWIATDRGVSKYDGYSFRNYSSADGLTDNTVFILTEDSAGKIWCGTSNRKLCYFSGDTILPYAYNAALETQSDRNLIQSLDVTPSGDVWVGTQRGGCTKIDASGKSSSFFSTLTDTIIRYDIYSSGNHFVFGSVDIRSADTKTGVRSSFININGKLQEIFLPGGTPYYFVVGVRKKNGTVLLGMANNVIEISPDLKFRTHTYPSSVLRINEDDAGNCWVSLRSDGVRQYPRGADLSGNDYSTFLANENVIDVMQDKEGGYWMTTLGHGIFYLASPHVHCLFPAGNTEKIPVTAIASKPNGEIMLGTSNGFLHSCAGGKIISTFDCNYAEEKSDFIQDVYASPSEAGIRICTNKDLLYIKPDGTIMRMIGSGFARTICSDGAGGCWMGGTNSMMHFNANEAEPDQKFALDTRIYELYWDSVSGKLLAGKLVGLFWLNHDKLEPFPVAGETLSARVSAIKRTASNALVIGTIGSGIYIVKDGHKKMISTKEGLPSPIVNDIDIDKHGDLWVATNAGVVQIHWLADTFAVNTFSIFHGLPTNEIRKIFCKSDTIWIATTSGAAWFIPRELRHAVNAPPIFIREIVVNGKQINAAADGNFSYDQGQVRISFLGISYRNGSNTTYRYRLAGTEDDWIYTSNRSVEYASLPPGNYRFEVMAKNGDGTWSASPASFAFIIRQPFWYKWWFWTAVVLLLAGAAGWIINRSLKNIRREALQKRLLGEYQHQALAAQMNPHFIFNSLSSMQAFVLSDEKENALRYIDRFSFLMRKSLEHSMLRFVPLEKEIELLRAYLDIEAMRFGDKLNYIITCDPSIGEQNIEVPTMLVQPFTENAVRHGLLHREAPGGKIIIDFTWKDDAVWCCVEDNGVGRKRSSEINHTRKKHLSFGSSITEERLRLLCNVTGQQYSINYTDKITDDGRPAGTIVYFKLPFRKREQHA
jgi:ligand-binding sensor domain-containing protein